CGIRWKQRRRQARGSWKMQSCADLSCGQRRNRRMPRHRAIPTMFYRLLFLLLIALNIGAAAWLVFGHPPTTPVPATTDPGVPELKLLSERAGTLPAQGTQPAQAGAAAAASDRCQSIGPFPTQVDMRAAMQALTPHVPRIQYREEEAHQSRGFWVYLPALPSRDAAL